ncbi:hypothetical protein EVG20_g6170 [Dentipellis fragilis]|uniref:Uncharacterized protein n=1 Tax=Dentipellis fragilis TaxID=205917 RepID=A0A4Y9YPX2_9AGAM|nr:hypothetical protein EVG20_g6170 [Dentipellis fragilis]
MERSRWSRCHARRRAPVESSPLRLSARLKARVDPRLHLPLRLRLRSRRHLPSCHSRTTHCTPQTDMSTDDADLSVSSLEPRIRAILTAPGVDFQTISAKRVRRQLAEDDTLPAGYVRARKEALDELITRVFAQISEENGLGGDEADQDQEEQDQDQGQAEGADEEGEEEVDEDEERERKEKQRPAKRKRSTEETKARPAKKKVGRELSDAELARKIDSELNGRQRRSRASAAGTGKANGTRKRKVKGAQTVDSDGDGDGEAKPKRKGGFSKEYLLSEPLAAMLQAERMSRPQVVKGLWDHIKGNSLQNPENKREIICDNALRAIFKTDKIGMFQMNKVLGQYVLIPPLVYVNPISTALSRHLSEPES